jgi:hypothetical protein
MKTFYRILRLLTEIFAVLYIILAIFSIIAAGIVVESNINPQATAYKHQDLGGSSLGNLVQWSFENPYWTLLFLAITIIGAISMSCSSARFKEWRQEHFVI